MRNYRTALLLLTVLVLPMDAFAGARDGIGLRAGLSRGPDQFVLGAQAELGPVLGPALFVPSLDASFSDGSSALLLNGDLRWYLLPLPETGVYFYGEAGPTLVVTPESGLGLSLAVGADIPMHRNRRYNLEMRFGFGDAPDLKILVGVVFGTS